jgi:hypothetical protein
VVEHWLIMRRDRWRSLVRELARRGSGRRESGAFLLGSGSTVRRVLLFDDLDPGCLTGAISIRGTAFGRLWTFCRQEGLQVLGDVHTHPGKDVRQSEIDRRNPMVARAGHIALIVPSFAQGSSSPADVGLHRYLGQHRWESHLGSDAASRLKLPWWTR